jgi:toxin ParE1/3/4
MILDFNSEAEIELIEAADWYENEREGLGDAFRAAVREAVTRIAADPEQFELVYASPRARRIRRLILTEFPYSIIYQIHAGGTTILAVAHARRRSQYWRLRRPNP